MDAGTKRDPHQIDVMNLSLGYYHETPEDGRFACACMKRSVGLRAARVRRRVLCGQRRDRPPDLPCGAVGRAAIPALELRRAGGSPRHLAVGALNPRTTSVALYSNIGDWVTHVRAGNVGAEHVPAASRAGSRPARGTIGMKRHRQSLDPDDFTGGFAIWSGTSFAAPFVAAMIAQELGDSLMTREQARQADPRRRSRRP